MGQTAGFAAGSWIVRQPPCMNMQALFVFYLKSVCLRKLQTTLQHAELLSTKAPPLTYG
jgi:hypothetical protein